MVEAILAALEAEIKRHECQSQLITDETIAQGHQEMARLIKCAWCIVHEQLEGVMACNG